MSGFVPLPSFYPQTLNGYVQRRNNPWTDAAAKVAASAVGAALENYIDDKMMSDEERALIQAQIAEKESGTEFNQERLRMLEEELGMNQDAATYGTDPITGRTLSNLDVIRNTEAYSKASDEQKMNMERFAQQWADGRLPEADANAYGNAVLFPPPDPNATPEPEIESNWVQSLGSGISKGYDKLQEGIKTFSDKYTVPPEERATQITENEYEEQARMLEEMLKSSGYQ